MVREKKIVFDGIVYALNGNYYRKHKWSGKGPSNLHRAIWERHNGPIPEGMEIHHKDEDTFNNDISNLECVDAIEHQRKHMKERQAAGLVKPPSKEALLLAAEWHRSEEGKKWHKEHGENISKRWKEKAYEHKVICETCGVQFMTPFPSRAKFCHQNCKAAALRKRRGMKVLGRKYVVHEPDGKRAVKE